MSDQGVSAKIAVIEHIWDTLVAEGTGRRVVNQDDVAKSIEHCNKTAAKTLSKANLANFMKDIVRKDNANRNWPQRLTDMRIGARQRPGQGRVFEFVDFQEGQTEPFPNKYTATPDLVSRSEKLQAVSLSQTKRLLGRKDESWLVQVAIELRIVETHLATKTGLDIVELNHLQTGVKLGTAEVDCLFLAHVRICDRELQQHLVICEAKQQGERILEHQLIEQAVAASRSVTNAGIAIAATLPVAIKAIDDGKVYVAAFNPISVAALVDVAEEDLPLPVLSAEAVYELVPPVPGVGAVRAKVKP